MHGLSFELLSRLHADVFDFEIRALSGEMRTPREFSFPAIMF